MDLKQVTNFTLSTFSEVPDELIGCGCTYATTEEDFDNRNLIYANDLGELGMIVVNNKPRMVDLTKNSKSPFFIEVTVDSVLAKGYESEKIRGQMIVKYAGEEIFNSEVTGICGC